MESYDIHQLARSIEKIETFLYELAGYEEQILAFGLGRVLASMDLSDVKEMLDDVPQKLNECVLIANRIDTRLAGRLEALIAETRVEEAVTQLAVRLRVAEIRRTRPLLSLTEALVYVSRRIGISFRRNSADTLFSDSAFSVSGLLASLKRLRTTVELIYEEFYRRTSGDDEVFKPSRIDLNIIVNEINLAMNHIQAATDIPQDERTKLIEYLAEARVELAKDSPAWRRIVGALVICATVLGGIAAAPEATHNIESAIKHILGTGVEKILPNLLPAPEPEDEAGPRIIST